MKLNAQPKIKSIAPWFGGKRTMADDIILELGEHVMYVEPFCGSMAVLLSKHPCSSFEIANDLHGDLVNLAMVLASDWYEKLYEKIRRTLVCEAIFDEAKVSLELPPYEGALYRIPAKQINFITSSHVERAYWFFIVSWMGRNGVSGTQRKSYQMARRWTPNGGGGSTRFASAVDSIPAWHQRLRKVEIYQMNGFDLLAKLDDHPGLAIYCDPPYFRNGAKTGKCVKDLYLHNFTIEDHTRLAESLNRFRKARIVLSYYADDRLEELYPSEKWTHRKMTMKKNLHLCNKRGAARGIEAPEVLLINGPANQQTGTLF